jgi:hypothetical protein
VVELYLASTPPYIFMAQCLSNCPEIIKDVTPPLELSKTETLGTEVLNGSFYLILLRPLNWKNMMISSGLERAILRLLA